MSFIETHTESQHLRFLITGLFERNEFYENQIGMSIVGGKLLNASSFVRTLSLVTTLVSRSFG